MASRIRTGLCVGALALSACQQTTTPQTETRVQDACGADRYQGLVGGPSSAVSTLNIPGDSRHYGRTDATAHDTPERLNFVHSGTALESVINPNSTVIRVFCG